MSPTPQFRATWTKFAIQAINRSPKRATMRRLLGEPTLDRIRAASVLDWLPIEVHLAVAQAVYDASGAHAAREFWRELLKASFETKLMSPIVGGAAMVFGNRLFGLFKMSVYSYRLIARDAGTIAVREEPGGCVAIRFVEQPAALVQSVSWQALCHGHCQAVLDHAGAGPATIALGDVAADSYVYRVCPK